MNSDTGILIIEDDRNLCSFMTTGLIDNGYHVTPAFTGSEGLRLAASTNPDIILLDLGLPDMDGFAAAIDVHPVSPAAAGQYSLGVNKVHVIGS